jgi:hypothetical protein
MIENSFWKGWDRENGKIMDGETGRSLEDNGDKSYCFCDDKEEFAAWKNDKYHSSFKIVLDISP